MIYAHGVGFLNQCLFRHWLVCILSDYHISLLSCIPSDRYGGVCQYVIEVMSCSCLPFLSANMTSRALSFKSCMPVFGISNPATIWSFNKHKPPLLPACFHVCWT